MSCPFKIGDLVRVKEEKKNGYVGELQLWQAYFLRGKVGRVVQILEDLDGIYVDDVRQGWWPSEVWQLATPREKKPLPEDV